MPNVAQSAETTNGIMLMVSIIPAVAALIAVAALWFYEIDEKLIHLIASDLEQRKSVGRDL